MFDNKPKMVCYTRSSTAISGNAFDNLACYVGLSQDLFRRISPTLFCACSNDGIQVNMHLGCARYLHFAGLSHSFIGRGLDYFIFLFTEFDRRLNLALAVQFSECDL